MPVVLPLLPPPAMWLPIVLPLHGWVSCHSAQLPIMSLSCRWCYCGIGGAGAAIMLLLVMPLSVAVSGTAVALRVLALSSHQWCGC